MKVNLDPDTLTFGDMEDFESYVGTGLLEVCSKIETDGGVAGVTAKEMTGLIWICGRGADPTFTLEQARGVKLTELEVEVAPAVDPPPAAD